VLPAFHPTGSSTCPSIKGEEKNKLGVSGVGGLQDWAWHLVLEGRSNIWWLVGYNPKSSASCWYISVEICKIGSFEVRFRGLDARKSFRLGEHRFLQ
jgi:hypothetical protein